MNCIIDKNTVVLNIINVCIMFVLKYCEMFTWTILYNNNITEIISTRSVVRCRRVNKEDGWKVGGDRAYPVVSTINNSTIIHPFVDCFVDQVRVRALIGSGSMKFFISEFRFQRNTGVSLVESNNSITN